MNSPSQTRCSRQNRRLSSRMERSLGNPGQTRATKVEITFVSVTKPIFGPKYNQRTLSQNHAKKITLQT